MKICPNCNAECVDEATFCNACGCKLTEAQPQQPPQQQTQQNPNSNQSQQQYNPQYNQYAQQYYPVNIYDHTSEFDAADISENKIFAVLPYLLGVMGVIVALLGCKESKFARFHVKQALKFTVTEILLGIVTLLLCWTLIVPIAAAIMYMVLFVLEIISFINACAGKAIEPAIIRSLGFLK